MKFGLTESEYKFLQDKVIHPLQDKFARVYLFGSRARGQHKKFSDVDILFIPSDPSLIQNHFLFLMREEIESSRFPYKVDLVNFNDLAKSYKEKIDKEKIEL